VDEWHEAFGEPGIEMLAWTPSPAIGVPEIDAQHETLLERAGGFEVAVRAHEQTFRLADLSGYLLDYARVHFAAEEQLMRDVGYPGLAEQVHEHSEFTRRLRSLVPQWESEDGSTAMLAALVGFLDSWLTDHVSSSDQLFGDYVRSRKG
jgi:hemerythrin